MSRPIELRHGPYRKDRFRYCKGERLNHKLVFSFGLQCCELGRDAHEMRHNVNVGRY